MGLFSFITDLFKPAEKIIDELNFSGEEKGKLRNELANIQSKANAKFIELELAAINARKEITIAESNSPHKITATWRPVSSCILVLLVCLGSLGYANLTPEFYDFAKAFLGIYLGGRSVEKAASVIKLGKN